MATRMRVYCSEHLQLREKELVRLKTEAICGITFRDDNGNETNPYGDLPIPGTLFLTSERIVFVSEHNVLPIPDFALEDFWQGKINSWDPVMAQAESWGNGKRDAIAFAFGFNGKGEFYGFMAPTEFHEDSMPNPWERAGYHTPDNWFNDMDYTVAMFNYILREISLFRFARIKRTNKPDPYWHDGQDDKYHIYATELEEYRKDPRPEVAKRYRISDEIAERIRNGRLTDGDVANYIRQKIDAVSRYMEPSSGECNWHYGVCNYLVATMMEGLTVEEGIKWKPVNRLPWTKYVNERVAPAVRRVYERRLQNGKRLLAECGDDKEKLAERHQFWHCRDPNGKWTREEDDEREDMDLYFLPIDPKRYFAKPYFTGTLQEYCNAMKVLMNVKLETCKRVTERRIVSSSELMHYAHYTFAALLQAYEDGEDITKYKVVPRNYRNAFHMADRRQLAFMRGETLEELDADFIEMCKSSLVVRDKASAPIEFT